MLKKNHCMTALITKALKEKDIDSTTLKEDNDGSKDKVDVGEEVEGELSDDGEEDENELYESGGQSADESENSENDYVSSDDD